MDVAGEGAAPGRVHVLQAAKAAELPVAVAAQAIDELLGCVTPQLLSDLAKALPLRTDTVKTVQRAMQINHARLAQ
jgi:hypothetical protein